MWSYFLPYPPTVRLRTSSASSGTGLAILTAVISRENNPNNLQQRLQRAKSYCNNPRRLYRLKRDAKRSCLRNDGEVVRAKNDVEQLRFRGTLAKMIADVSFIAPTRKKSRAVPPRKTAISPIVVSFEQASRRQLPRASWTIARNEIQIRCNTGEIFENAEWNIFERKVIEIVVNYCKDFTLEFTVKYSLRSFHQSVLNTLFLVQQSILDNLSWAGERKFVWGETVENVTVGNKYFQKQGFESVWKHLR